MEPERIKDLIEAGETDLIEFKREWWDLESKMGKAALAKDILAMANAIAPGESGFIVIGVEDKRAGGAVKGVSKPPPQETVAQVLVTYTNPVPRIKLEEVLYEDKTLSVLEIIWSEFHPHYPTRDVDTVLSTDAVYTRRAGTVGRLKPAEIERLIRAKEARLGKITERIPLDVGFVELPTRVVGDRVSVRVANVIEEAVTNINASVDIILINYPRAVQRMSLLHELTLGPGQTREFDFRPFETYFYGENGKRLDVRGASQSRWIDLRLHLRYRARDGTLSEIIREVSLD